MAFNILQCFSDFHDTLTEVTLFLTMHQDQTRPVFMSCTACKPINTTATFSCSEVKYLVQGSFLGSLKGSRERKKLFLQRVQCVKQLGWIASAAFSLFPWKQGAEELLLSFTLQLLNKIRNNIKAPTPDLLYLKGHDALYKRKLLQKCGEIGVCSHEHARIYTAHKLWHLKKYIYQLLAILKTLQHATCVQCF